MSNEKQNWFAVVQESERLILVEASVLRVKATMLYSIGMDKLAEDISNSARRIEKAVRSESRAIYEMLSDEVRKSQDAITETFVTILKNRG